MNARLDPSTRRLGLFTDRGRGVAAALAAVGLLAGCGQTAPPFALRPSEASITTSAAPATPISAWASEPIDTLAIGKPPDFPPNLDQWALRESWSTLPRAFAGDRWTVTDGPNFDRYPVSMSSCSNERFLVRWRAVDNLRVQAAQVDEEGKVGKQVVGSAGWMDLDACSGPAFKLAGAFPNGGNLEDVTVEVREYQPAP